MRKVKTINICLPFEMVKRLDKISEKTGIPKSRLIRKSLEYLEARLDVDEPRRKIEKI